jgi:hypothetical protein
MKAGVREEGHFIIHRKIIYAGVAWDDELNNVFI